MLRRDHVKEGHLDHCLYGDNMPLVSELRATIRDSGDLVRDIDNEVRPLGSSFEDVVKSARMTLEQTQHTLLAIDRTVGKESTLPYQLKNTLKELSAAARSIRTLADSLERHPEALIRGKGDQ